MSTMKVKAAPGVKVPREDNARRYITSDESVEVARSAYYLRQLAAGDLITISPDNNPGPVVKSAAAPAKNNTNITEVDGGKS